MKESVKAEDKRYGQRVVYVRVKARERLLMLRDVTKLKKPTRLRSMMMSCIVVDWIVYVKRVEGDCERIQPKRTKIC